MTEISRLSAPRGASHEDMRMCSDFSRFLSSVQRILGACTVVGMIYLATTDYSTGQQGETTSAPPQSKSQTSGQSQAAPQENMGQLDTRSGGAPASSPQGDTPPGMQPVPSDRTKPPK